MEIVIVEGQVGLQLGGTKEAVAPDGRPEAEKKTDWLVPEIKVASTMAETEPP